MTPEAMKQPSYNSLKIKFLDSSVLAAIFTSLTRHLSNLKASRPSNNIECSIRVK
jgi:hypothetical protein